ncbi:competence protein ComEC [Amycolatopsis xylanica]|uniref:Competence protein ComEC n=1 Tax=Amycolatopsis xylanica TaxID=589385 RepID=A0A1H3HI00_9PSEU|nr:ComEC/Rec2 family competence protein [Amycolatopsis xylanica]SDY14424.1 competence protein ComEC [Amycolatopsis xylanica]
MKPPKLGTKPEPADTHHDLRLVPAAISIWLGTLACAMFGWWMALVCGALSALTAIVVIVRFRGRDPTFFAMGAALLVCGLVMACPLAIRLLRAEQDAVRPLAARGDTAVVRVALTDRPRPIRGAGFAGMQAGVRSVLLAAELERVEVAGRPVASTGRVLLIAPVAGWLELLPGQRVTTTGVLAPPTQGASLTVAVVSVRGPPVEVSGAPWWQRVAETMRAGLRKACQGLSEEAAGLLPGLAVGDTSALSPRVEREFLTAGMTHLTAVSGSNVAIVCGAILVLLRVFRLGPRFSAVAAGAALAGFVVLAGPDPSVLRAGVMGGIGLLALALGRSGSVLSALSVAVCGLLVYDPAMAVNLGFALSVLATAGLVLLAPRWAETLTRRGVPAGIAAGLMVPLAAFVVTAPVLAGMAGRLSLVSVVANVVAAPVVAPATVLTVFATVVATCWPGAAHVLVMLAEPETNWLIAVARHAARAPGAVVPWPGGWAGGVLAVVVLVAIWLVLRRRKSRIALAVLLTVVLLVFVPPRLVAPSWPPGNWAMVTCDVGQGDAVVLATDEPGRAVLIDTGPEPGPVDECLKRLGVERIPLVIISHLHADHIGGLTSVFDGRSVGAVAVGPGRAPGWAWRQVEETTRRHGIPLAELTIGQRLEWPELAIDVLGPHYVTQRGADQQDGTAINNASVVLRAQTAAGKVLLTGDVELAAQADLLEDGDALRADVLKVPHHGSRYSLPQFLAAVAPRVAMVSVGAGNRYGHPAKSTLDTLAAVGALVTRTDADGDVAVLADQGGPAVSRRRGPGP